MEAEVTTVFGAIALGVFLGVYFSHILLEYAADAGVRDIPFVIKSSFESDSELGIYIGSRETANDLRNRLNASRRPHDPIFDVEENPCTMRLFKKGKSDVQNI